MRKLILAFLAILLHKIVIAQNTVTFDALTYTEPINWKFTDNGSYRTYLDINHNSNTFCVISIYGTTSSSGNAMADFQAAWQSDVVNHFYVDKNSSPIPGHTNAGVSYIQGDGLIHNDKGNYFSRLVVFTLKDKSQSLLFLSINEAGLLFYKSNLDSFLSSIQFAGETNLTKVSNNTIEDPLKKNVTATTTNFDDGWTATTKENYVLLTKNNSKVLLYYGEKFTDESRANTTEYFYTRQVSKEYTITNVHARSDEYKYIIEGDAVEKSTGRQCYVVMNVVADNGIAKTVVEVSPTLNELMEQVGIDFTKMLTYNRFGVALQNIEGLWKSGSGNTQSYYDYYTGNYAGSSAVVMSDKFIFNRDGSFEEEFKGGTGKIGNMNFYQQHYKGVLSILSPWQISTTDQDNKTVIYDCWLEAIKGGMILHLINHQYTANTYDLLREINK